MKNIAEFFYQLNDMGFAIWLENGKLKYRQYKEHAHKNEILNKIKDDKIHIINFLNINNCGNSDLVSPYHIYKSGNSQEVLSFAQERLWFIEKYEEGSNAYNIPMIFKLANDVKLDLIERSIKSIVSRHKILRTLIKEDDEGKGYQLVCDEKEHPFLVDKMEVTNRLQLDQELEKHVNHVYDLAYEYPIKVCLYELKNSNNAEFYISIVIHHIAFDGWSVDILIRELCSYYNYYLEELQDLTPSLNLPPLPIQYKDFALWQRSYLSEERIEKQLNYWKSKLEGCETLNIMTDKRRPAQIDYRGKDISFTFDEETSNALRELAKELKVSLYSLLLGGYYLMLRVYSKDDIVIGTPVANRHYSQVENLIGFFVNLLALRVQIDLKNSVKEFIQKIGEEVIEAQLHQDLPFEKLAEDLKVPKDTSRHPVFQVTFGVQDFGGEIYKGRSDEKTTNIKSLLEPYTPEESVYNIAKFDISTLIDDSQVCLRGRVNYAVSLYGEGTIYWFIETYTTILKQLADLAHDSNKQEQTKLFDLRYINQDQYQQIICTWNQTDKAYPNNKTISELFEEQVDKTPNNIAVIYEEQELTYQELNQKANQLAHYLRSLGVGPDTLVAIAVDRSLEMIIGLLGILKAGGAYVPLDPEYPQERLQFMLDDTNASILITQSHLKERFKDYSGELFSLYMDPKSKALSIEKSASDFEKSIERWINLYQELSENPRNLTSPHHLAYVIYTSGSTGKPKGVMVGQKGLLNRLIWMQNRYQLTAIDRVIQKTPFTFDVSIWELFWPLLVGSTEIIAKAQIHKDPNLLLDLIEKKKVSVCHFVPSMLESFLNIQTAQKQNSLRLIITSGEALLHELSKKYYLKLDIPLHNLYGPTEASIDVTHYDCFKGNDIVTIPIGRPISNTQIYILDSCMNPVPVGVSGEIYIGGVGLARGYLNRPELTAEKFVPNPFINEELIKEKRDTTNTLSLRLYRTGDLARYLPDGNIEFLGRIDDQVKIRGFRIELGEIESNLAHHGDVNQAVVIAREDEPGHKQLVAYLVPNNTLLSSLETETILTSSTKEEFSTLQGERISSLTEDLKNYLARTLPEYMIPAFFVFIDKIPLTPNGKIDRKALPAPDLSLRQVGEEYVAPQTTLQRELCSIWAEILKIEKIGIHDNFFKLGGHSLLATQVISRIRHTYNIDLPLRALFEHPTVAALSQDIEQLGVVPGKDGKHTRNLSEAFIHKGLRANIIFGEIF